jgi:hypothetical protein
MRCARTSPVPCGSPKQSFPIASRTNASSGTWGVHRRLIVATDEAWPPALRCRQPRREGGLPPSRGTAATVQGHTVAPVSDRAIDRRAYLQEPANLTRERVALQKRARDITRGDKPVTDLAGPGARNIPTGTNGRLGHANSRHPRHVTEVVEAGAIDRLLVLQVSRRE